MKKFKSLSEPMKIALIGALAAVVAAIVGALITGIFTLHGSTVTQPTPPPIVTGTSSPPTATAAPTITPDPTAATVPPSTPTGEGTATSTLPTFTGTGGGNAQSFPVGANWSLDVSCASSTHYESGDLQVSVVDTSDSRTIDGPLSVSVCTRPGDYAEKVPESQDGTFYLQVQVNPNTAISWEIQIHLCGHGQSTC